MQKKVAKKSSVRAKKSPVGSDFVKAAKAKVAADEASVAASKNGKTSKSDAKAKSKSAGGKKQAEKKVPKKKSRRDEFDFEENATLLDSDVASVEDDASEYQPTQGNNFEAAERRSPRPSRRSSARVNKGKKNAEEKEDAQTAGKGKKGATPINVRRRKKAATTSKKERDAKDAEPELPKASTRAEIATGIDELDNAKSRSKKSKSSKATASKKARDTKDLEPEESSKASIEASKASCTDVVRSRRGVAKKDESVELDKGGDRIVDERSKGRRTKSRGKQQSKPSIQDGKAKKEEKSLEKDDIVSDNDASKGVDEYDNNAGSFEVDYDETASSEIEMEVGMEGGLPFTQAHANASQFMQQSSQEEADNDDEQFGGDDGKKLKSVEVNTRHVSNLRPSQFMDESVVASTAASTKSKVRESHDEEKSNASESDTAGNNLGASIELTTRGIDAKNHAALLQALQTQPQTQDRSQMSAVSPEALAETANSTNNENEEHQNVGKENSAGGKRGNVDPELVRALKKVRYHLNEADKYLAEVCG